MTPDETYKNLLEDIIENGSWRSNRTGLATLEIFGRYLKFDLRDGFPILTRRQVPMKSAMVELEGFINGITSKKWYEDRKCKYWSYWCSKKIVPYANDENTKKRMREIDELGSIYGAQWRNFKSPNDSFGIDQLKVLVDKVKRKHDDRRLIINAWNR